MGIYLVDYENVHCDGLNGIAELSKHDSVVIFYSTSAYTIDINVLVNTKAKIKFVKAECGTANALDFQLVTFLCRNAKKSKKYYVVSGDRGFIPAINMLHEYDITVDEIPCIRAAIEKNKEERKEAGDTDNIIQIDLAQNDNTSKGIGTYYENKVAENDPVTEIGVIIMNKLGVYPAQDMMDMVIKGLKTTYSKTEFYLYCTQNMGPAAGQTFYSKLKKVYPEMVQLSYLVS